MTMWYSLDKKSKVNRQGVVKVHLTFSSEKNNQVAAQEHRHLLRILLLHELEMSKVSAQKGPVQNHGNEEVRPIACGLNFVVAIMV